MKVRKAGEKWIRVVWSHRNNKGSGLVTLLIMREGPCENTNNVVI